ncbi:hypothetical protein ATCC90586_000972 [Pythium insidiosum]|nr:hypothetical protein ATCC90586_000972 [Pythium insidiosum]
MQLVSKCADKYDPQTIADRRSQQRMIHALRHVWPHVRIIGEEGDLDHADEADRLPAADVVVWIDPLDGTKKFAEKKFDEVSVLLGIALRERPIAGVMHLPFDSDGVTLWGGPGIGLFRSQHTATAATHERVQRPAPLYPARPLRATVSGTPCALVTEALRRLAPEHVQLGGATGTMVMSVVLGHSDAFFRFRNATKRWDICAVEPLLQALGGSLTDKRGRVYQYDPSDPRGDDYDNGFGLLATVSADAQRLVRDVMDSVDVLSTPDGRSLIAPAWLQSLPVFAAVGVSSCDVVPGTVRRGKQSVVATLRVGLREELPPGAGTSARHLFIKRFVKRELPPRSERQWTRDFASYHNEAFVYQHLHSELSAHGISMIPPVAVVFDHGEAPRDCLVLLDDVLRGSPRRLLSLDCLGKEDAKTLLRFLAKLHAAPLADKRLLALAEKHLWPQGAWWTLAKRGVEELQHAPEVWRGVLAAFRGVLENDFAVAITPALEALGERMVAHAAYVSEQLFGETAAPKTLIHGDAKTANFFFDASTRQEVTAFDWQWTGLGLGALDVANLLNTSVAIDALDDGTETELLESYLSALRQELEQGGHPLEYSLHELRRHYQLATLEYARLRRHYQLATLEYARVLIANFWRDMTPETCAQDMHKTNWGLGYRSVPHVVCMIRKLDEGLRAVELERPGEQSRTRMDTSSSNKLSRVSQLGFK